jgi:hypothetical protein
MVAEGGVSPQQRTGRIPLLSARRRAARRARDLEGARALRAWGEATPTLTASDGSLAGERHRRADSLRSRRGAGAVPTASGRVSLGDDAVAPRRGHRARPLDAGFALSTSE